MTRQVNSIAARAMCGLMLSLAAAPMAIAQSAGSLTPDTTLKLVLVDRLRSGSSRQGDRVNLRMDEDVVDPFGHVLIRRGTPAYGTVTESRGAGTFGRRGRLGFSIDYTTAVDGQRVPLRARLEKAGKSNSGVSIFTFTFVALGGFFIKGSNTTLEPGTPLLAYVDGSLTVNTGAVPGTPEGGALVGASPLKTLRLSNGDRITGRLESLVGGIYTVVTDNGVLKIAAAGVAEIREAEPAGPPAARSISVSVSGTRKS